MARGQQPRRGDRAGGRPRSRAAHPGLRGAVRQPTPRRRRPAQRAPEPGGQDPAGSQWWPENGVWQDGAIVTHRPDGRYDVFLTRFSSQAGHTDGAGHPLA
ncbi:DUF2278 family protein [Streptomyces longwoodensis]|uniref:DUF2278 family protein n=1 Tax=Streptomyces longwoodensis TaxID=68231 RepID=UPI0038120A1C